MYIDIRYNQLLQFSKLQKNTSYISKLIIRIYNLINFEIDLYNIIKNGR
jgi:hypothetical protein